MNKSFFLPLLFLLISSCSLLLRQVYEEDKDRIYLLPETSPKLYCENAAELIGPSLKNQEVFWKFLKSIDHEKFESSDYFALWVLLHFDLRPDKVSPFAGVRLFESNGENLEYREFNQGSTPLITALNDFLKRQGSTQSLIKLSKILEKNYPNSLYVDEELETFLEKNKKNLWDVNEFRDIYFKDNQTLKSGETLPQYKAFTLTNSQDVTPTQKEILSNKPSFFCDHDNSIYERLPLKTFTIQENYPTPVILALKQGSKSYLLVIEQKLKFGSIKNGPFKAQATPPDKLAPFCYFPQGNNKLLFVAYNERDPEQFLFSLRKKMNQHFSQKIEIANLISEPRKLTLVHPTRILIEADNNRLSQNKDQELEKLFQGDYPVFQATKLALINALFIEPSKKESGFITDKRVLPTISCKEIMKEKLK